MTALRIPRRAFTGIFCHLAVVSGITTFSIVMVDIAVAIMMTVLAVLVVFCLSCLFFAAATTVIAIASGQNAYKDFL